VGALYKNGVVTADAVTISGGAGLYKWSVTLPVLAAGDVVQVYITATVATVATAAVVWSDVGDTKLTSNLNDIAAGAAMTLTDAAVDAVWNEVQSGHTSASTFGAYLDAKVSGRSTLGAGATTWTYTVTDTLSVPIADVDVWVTSDSAGANLLATGKTNASGVVTFYLDAGTTCYLFSQKSGYNFTQGTAWVIS
jgi:hypothetical protein